MKRRCLKLSMAGLDPANQPAPSKHWMAASRAAMERGRVALKALV